MSTAHFDRQAECRRIGPVEKSLAAQQTLNTRPSDWEEGQMSPGIFERLRSHKALIILQIAITILLAVGGIISILMENNREGLWLNLGTELLGASVTYFLLSLLVGRLEKTEERQRDRDELRARLIWEMGSQEHETALRAVISLWNSPWLIDGSLEGKIFNGADLSHAWLKQANLKMVHLQYAKLDGAQLGGAILQGADIQFATMNGAWLTSTDLRGANLYGVDLANVSHLERAIYDTDTVLPDGNKYDPNSTDMSFFADPQRWRSDDPRSPAYQRKPLLGQAKRRRKTK